MKLVCCVEYNKTGVAIWCLIMRLMARSFLWIFRILDNYMKEKVIILLIHTRTKINFCNAIILFIAKCRCLNVTVKRYEPWELHSAKKLYILTRIMLRTVSLSLSLMLICKSAQAAILKTRVLSLGLCYRYHLSFYVLYHISLRLIRKLYIYIL